MLNYETHNTAFLMFSFSLTICQDMFPVALVLKMINSWFLQKNTWSTSEFVIPTLVIPPLFIFPTLKLSKNSLQIAYFYWATVPSPDVFNLALQTTKRTSRYFKRWHLSFNRRLKRLIVSWPPLFLSLHLESKHFSNGGFSAQKQVYKRLLDKLHVMPLTHA